MSADGCHDGAHSPNETAGTVSARQPAKKYFCPMCEGVESDKPGSCPKCGMALERESDCPQKPKAIYTCPMHPADRAGSSRELPDLRDGAGAEERPRRRRRGKRGTARHDAAVLDRRSAQRCRCSSSRWRTCSRQRRDWVHGRSFALDAIHLEHAGRALGRLAVLRPRLALNRAIARSTCLR